MSSSPWRTDRRWPLLTLSSQRGPSWSPADAARTAPAHWRFLSSSPVTPLRKLAVGAEGIRHWTGRSERMSLARGACVSRGAVGEGAGLQSSTWRLLSATRLPVGCTRHLYTALVHRSQIKRTVNASFLVSKLKSSEGHTGVCCSRRVRAGCGCCKGRFVAL